MKHLLLSRSVISLIALAPLALVASASAAYTNTSATSGLMTVQGTCTGSAYNCNEFSYPVPTMIYPDWGLGLTGWVLAVGDSSGTPAPFNFGNITHPRVEFNIWQSTGVAAVAKGVRGIVDNFPVYWSIDSLQMNFGVTTNDTIEISTQHFGVFNASFEYQGFFGGWNTVAAWSNLGATNTFAVSAGYNYRFNLSGGGAPTSDVLFNMDLASGAAPAPGALALLGMAGIFGGRRRR